MSNFDLTCLDMLIKVPFWINVVSLNMPRMVLESPWIWFWKMGKNHDGFRTL